MNDNRLTTPPIFSKRAINYINNNVIVKNYCVGLYEESFICVSDIERVFKNFSHGAENMATFLKGEFAYVAPNARIKTFIYDPFTGEKIQWDLIRKAILGNN